MVHSFRSATIKKLLSPFSEADIEDIKNTSFDPLASNEGYLFLGYSDNNYIFEYLRKVPITYGDYENGYVTKKRTVVKETTFHINLERMVIVIFSGQKDSAFFIRRFINNFGVLISNLDIDFLDILKCFALSEYTLRSEQATINGFVYNDLIVGTYIANITDMEVFKRILKKYDGIRKINVCVEHYDADVSKISIDKNGSFRFNNISGKNNEILDFLILKMLNRG